MIDHAAALSPIRGERELRRNERDAQHVDQRAAGELRPERLGHAQQPEVVDLHDLPRVVDVRGQRRGQHADAGVVDDEVDVGELRRGLRHLLGSVTSSCTGMTPSLVIESGFRAPP